jgi:hypothetical protein
MRKLLMVAVLAVVIGVSAILAPHAFVHACSVGGGSLNPCHA